MPYYITRRKKFKKQFNSLWCSQSKLCYVWKKKKQFDVKLYLIYPNSRKNVTPSLFSPIYYINIDASFFVWENLKQNVIYILIESNKLIGCYWQAKAIANLLTMIENKVKKKKITIVIIRWNCNWYQKVYVRMVYLNNIEISTWFFCICLYIFCI